ncbi:MAG: AraC family transcriptional regulator ligand-binding domain-containing protein [Pseudomonadota bacterium]
MAGRQHGFTRVSALGPIAQFVAADGVRIDRLLADVDLPVTLLDYPDLPIPLREQFRLLQQAAKATGDPHFGARLGQHVRIDKLSAFGRWVTRAETLEASIERCERGLNAFLQTATILRLERGPEVSRWSIEFLDPESDGRYQNELLGVSYLIDTVRQYLGPDWTPRYVATTCRQSNQAGQLEHLFGANVVVGRGASTIEIPTAALSQTREARRLKGTARVDPSGGEPNVPKGLDDGEAVAALTRLALLQDYPRVDWVAKKMGLTRRTLQRRLKEADVTFSDIAKRVICDSAKELVGGTARPITDIALSLGYSDPAHFSRAFRQWTGLSPVAYRRDAE